VGVAEAGGAVGGRRPGGGDPDDARRRVRLDQVRLRRLQGLEDYLGVFDQATTGRGEQCATAMLLD
jgi:hypothetical protein